MFRENENTAFQCENLIPSEQHGGDYIILQVWQPATIAGQWILNCTLTLRDNSEHLSVNES